MQESTAKQMKSGDEVTFRDDMGHVGTYPLADDAEFINVADGGSGHHFYLTIGGAREGPYHCSMFKDPISV